MKTKQKILKYTVVIEPAKEGGYTTMSNLANIKPRQVIKLLKSIGFQES